ncbi:MAG TPA: hypothetical protein VK153_02345 [Candidatus Paceibacterota bacterium]|nr:hypothetical protein [Candidatus Paceibacterota bacterium]
MKYNKLDLGTIEALVNKLGGMEGVNKFLSNKTRIIEVSEKICFKIWKKINVGTHKNLEELYTSLIFPPLGIKSNMTHEGYGIGEILYEICPVLSSQKREEKLVNISPLELGIKRGLFLGVTLEDVCNLAQKNGLLLCSEEAVFQLAIQGVEKRNEKVHIPTKSGVFILNWDSNNLFLSVYQQFPTVVYQKKDRFVFLSGS